MLCPCSVEFVTTPVGKNGELAGANLGNWSGPVMMIEVKAVLVSREVTPMPPT